jgi:hypothetical protein
MKNDAFWEKKPVRTSQETLHISAKGSSQLIQRNFSGFHCGYYEECRLLSYENGVRISQEIYYISATEPSLLMLYKI